jgi:hypothetical protein
VARHGAHSLTVSRRSSRLTPERQRHFAPRALAARA